MLHKHEILRKPTRNILSDVILGGQDGLVNVLGVILGIAVASDNIKIVIAGGLAATFAESISMAAVALTSKMSQQDYYEAELEQEEKEIKENPQQELAEIRAVYQEKGFEGKILDDIVKHISSKQELWLDFMVKEELEIKKVENKDIYQGSIIVGVSALVGSFIPMTPFFFLPIHSALIITLILSVIALFSMGVYKAKTTIGKPIKSGLVMTIIGMSAALAGYVIGILFS